MSKYDPRTGMRTSSDGNSKTGSDVLERALKGINSKKMKADEEENIRHMTDYRSVEITSFGIDEYDVEAGGFVYLDGVKYLFFAKGFPATEDDAIEKLKENGNKYTIK